MAIPDNLFHVVMREAGGTVETTAVAAVGSAHSRQASLLDDEAAFAGAVQMMRRFQRNRLTGEEARELGARLYEQLLPPPLDKLFAEARRECSGALVLKISSEILRAAALPWELVYDRRRRVFLALDPSLSIVRGWPEEREDRRPPRPSSDSLRILAVLSSPVDQYPLDLAGERQALEEAFADLIRDGQLTLTFLDRPVTLAKVEEALAGDEYDVLHFVGHGTAEAIFLTDERGQTQPVSPEQLQLLAEGRWLRLAAVSSANSASFELDTEVAADPVRAFARSDVPLVLGLQAAMTDATAIFFDRALYVGIAAGLPVEQAMTHARRKTYLEFGERTDWAAPVLYSVGNLPEPLLRPRQRQASAQPPVGQQLVSNVGGLVGAPEDDYYVSGRYDVNVQQKIDTVGDRPATGVSGAGEEPLTEAFFEGVSEELERESSAPAGEPSGPGEGPPLDGPAAEGEKGVALEPPGLETPAEAIAGNGQARSRTGAVSTAPPLPRGVAVDEARAAIIAGSQTPRHKIEALALIEQLDFALEDGRLDEAERLLQQVLRASQEAAEAVAALAQQLALARGD